MSDSSKVLFWLILSCATCLVGVALKAVHWTLAMLLLLAGLSWFASIQVQRRWPRSHDRTRRESASIRTSSVAEELAKLAALKDAGVLTDDEFAEQKRRLLGAKP